MKTEKLEYRLYGQVLLNWFTNKRGPEKVVASVVLNVEQTWNEKADQAEWHRIGGPREFTWKAPKTTVVTRCAMESPRIIGTLGKKEILMPMFAATIESGNTVTIVIPEMVATLR